MQETAAKQCDIEQIAPSRVGIDKMFDRIASRYDFLNHVLSFGYDIHWRQKAVSMIPDTPGQIILDCACGTADLALTIRKNRPSASLIAGIDMAGEMLRIAGEKILRKHASQHIKLVCADGMMLPVQENVCDAALIAFGIRNIIQPETCLNEMRRALKPGGRIIILEFSVPANRIIRTLYLFYFRYLLPGIGGLISGDRNAYAYLNRSVETFQYGTHFHQLLYDTGYAQISSTVLTCGIASIYTAEKPKNVNAEV